MGERSSICCVGARSTLHEQQTHQKLGRATWGVGEPGWRQGLPCGMLPIPRRQLR